MNIFNFCGSGNSGGGGGGGLPQPMKVVDSSHGEQLIQADVPYTSLGSVLIQAPNMENAVVDSSCNTIVVYTSPEDSSGNAYIGMDSVTINAPIMETRIVDASHGLLIIDRDTENYVGLEEVIVNAPNMSNVTVDASCNEITVYTPAVDSSGNAYVGMDSVTILAPVMETRTIDASYGALTIDRDTENYVGLEQVNINAPVMKSITINPSQDSSTVYNIVDEGDVAAGYVGIEQVTVPVVTAAIDSNITPENIKIGVTIIGVTGTFDYDYSTLYNRLVTI